MKFFFHRDRFDPSLFVLCLYRIIVLSGKRLRKKSHLAHLTTASGNQIFQVTY